MKDLKLPVSLENKTDAAQIVCIVPARAEVDHLLKGRFLTTGSFMAIAIIGASGLHEKPTEDHVILVGESPLDFEKIQRYILHSQIEISSVDVMSPNGEQLGISFAQRTYDAVTEIGYEDFDLPEIGELILRKNEEGKHYAQHDFVTSFKSGAFDSLLYLVKPNTKVELVISAKYSAVTNVIFDPEDQESTDQTGPEVTPVLE